MTLKRDELTQSQRWKLADMLAEDKLPKINEKCNEIQFNEGVYSKYIKRAIDIAISLICVILTLPINLVIALITIFDVGHPIFFTQERVGKDGKIFRIVKFRNMRNTRDERGELLPPEKRVTPWGKFVRKTSLDELLNFYSVLKGDMSIIGPRPLVPQYMTRYSKRHLGRYRVKPGLECPPRDFGTPLRTWNDQFENDVWYVENLSLKTDVQQVINLVRFTFDRKNTEIRSMGGRGDFMGYDDDGKAINLSQVPLEYLDRMAQINNASEGSNDD